MFSFLNWNWNRKFMLSEDYGCRSRVSGPMNTSSLLAYCECFLQNFTWWSFFYTLYGISYYLCFKYCVLDCRTCIPIQKYLMQEHLCISQVTPFPIPKQETQIVALSTKATKLKALDLKECFTCRINRKHMKQKKNNILQNMSKN